VSTAAFPVVPADRALEVRGAPRGRSGVRNYAVSRPSVITYRRAWRSDIFTSKVMTSNDPGAGLLGRRDECQTLDDLLAGARVGRSAAVVLRGEAGIGKTELLLYLRARATECRVVTAVGVQSEMELSYAGLHQLCAELLPGLDQLPDPQRNALSTAFGLRAGAAPDRFLVGLATLSLLADASSSEPLVCLIDDAQWLDQASALTMEFVARRLLAESVLLVFAVREGSAGEAFVSLPTLTVPSLAERDSRTLLGSVVTGPLDERIRDRIVAEARGNPLALLELPHALSAVDLAGGFGHPDARPLSSQLEESYLRRIRSLPSDTQRLLLIAAAEPVGDLPLLRRAAVRLGVDVDVAVSPPEVADLITLGTRVRFRHPLVRSAAYRAADRSAQREVHRALAEATDSERDPDRRVWHLASGTSGPDERVAAELERSADRARARGGVAAAAAFLARAAALTEDPARRGQRTVAAAEEKLRAGAFEQAATLLVTAQSDPLDELSRARIDLLNAEIAFARNRGSEAPPLLLTAARRLEELDAALARETYLEALSAGIFAGHLARGPGVRQVAEAARAAPPAPLPGVPDQLLDALAVRFTDGYSTAVPGVARAVHAFCEDAASGQETLRWMWLAAITPSDLWDYDGWYLLANRHVGIARTTGALSELPLALHSCVYVYLFTGELDVVASMVEEARSVGEATGSKLVPYGAIGLAAIRGHEQEARRLIDATLAEAAPRGEGIGVTMTHWAHAVLCNGLGQHEEALDAAQKAAQHQEELTAPRWGLVELIEAAARLGHLDVAGEALHRLSVTTRASGTDWALGVEARSRALLSDADVAEEFYLESVERLARTRIRLDLARTHLVYGEWLRRQQRRADARAQLTTAHEMLNRFGAAAFAERARRELHAAGAVVRSAPIETREPLTPQESQIARLAADGLTNPEIGAQLFLSRHTVDWHLRKVFSKLGISSRREIGSALREGLAAT
jgi:DNA-binding CsgD family transcriptional regulator